MRILIADDSVLLREGLTLILGDGGHEVRPHDVGDADPLTVGVLALLRLEPAGVGGVKTPMCAGRFPAILRVLRDSRDSRVHVRY